MMKLYGKVAKRTANNSADLKLYCKTKFKGLYPNKIIDILNKQKKKFFYISNKIEIAKIY